MYIKKKYKKRNNLTCKKGWWYYRLCWGTGGVDHKEKTIPLNCLLYTSDAADE